MSSMKLMPSHLRCVFYIWTKYERKNMKLASLSVDNVPTIVLSYCSKWSDSIVKYASSCHGIQFSGSDITVGHLAEYYANSGGNGNLGKEKTAAHCANNSKAHKGQKRKELTSEHCAIISKGIKGMNVVH
jgi:hypothetical protein